MAKGIEGRDDAEGDALLAAVCDEIVEAAKDLSYFHRWQPTDMVIWDNWRLPPLGVGDGARARAVHAPHDHRGRLRPRPIRGQRFRLSSARSRKIVMYSQMSVTIRP